MSQKNTIRIKLPDGRSGNVPRKVYVKAKTRQLREFGYVDLTEDAVDKQIDAILEKKSLGDGLTVIGMMMEDEVCIS